jgi:hypothetical protein
VGLWWGLGWARVRLSNNIVIVYIFHFGCKKLIKSVGGARVGCKWGAGGARVGSGWRAGGAEVGLKK